MVWRRRGNECGFGGEACVVSAVVSFVAKLSVLLRVVQFKFLCCKSLTCCV
jgi:hypothetical protein